VKAGDIKKEVLAGRIFAQPFCLHYETLLLNWYACILPPTPLLGLVPYCKRGKCGGVMKPDITFFGEKLDNSMKRWLEEDKKKGLFAH
jgi:NAD-dependent SIR2 family protein deacetylase